MLNPNYKGWYRDFKRHRYTSRLPEIQQLVNNFNIELREAEIREVLALAKTMEPDIVIDILTIKLFSDLSSLDIALGLTNRYSQSVRDYRYVWMFPFTNIHVEFVWARSQSPQTEIFKCIARGNRQQPRLRKFLTAFMEEVEAGRADETLRIDPRSCGNEGSAANLVEEVIHLFSSCVDSKDILERCMAGL